MAPSAEAVAVLANMATSALARPGEGHGEDHRRPPGAHGGRLHPPVQPGPGPQQHRVDRPPVCARGRGRPVGLAPPVSGGDRRRPGPVGSLGRRPVRFQGSGQPGLPGRGRCRLRPRGVPPGPLLGRPGPPVGAGPPHRHAGGRLRRHLRPGQLQRPPAPRLEGHDERSGAAFPDQPDERSEAGRGRARRAAFCAAGRPRLRRRRGHGHRP